MSISLPGPGAPVELKKPAPQSQMRLSFPDQLRPGVSYTELARSGGLAQMEFEIDVLTGRLTMVDGGGHCIPATSLPDWRHRIRLEADTGNSGHPMTSLTDRFLPEPSDTSQF
ncbi:hypothetical protein BO94DRAFT_55329 [Aspergillus sclerotioniger CBS 115572]|uniref:Uncharacterized protein n=1 Tax=Aspergillus sclerotioniger CBS 115572 TaxID=1450535 RepID=A0A317WN33_9EURO|nr:hypothetical protein BO94DRAFT_55329 [Aspergillus sclerotioniger CBS 115572]PWY87819.1 hypothetical protein BO94DRAFT_55329 [Aspergillus sclerotioniger CBS 115572]